VLSLLGFFTLLFFPTTELLARQVNLQDLMNGQVQGLTAVVRGSGRGWFGDSLQVFFENQTGETHNVKIPLGLRLVPEDISVQTMITAGGEMIAVPPGSSSNLFKAFCGEKNDHAPGTSDIFHPDGFVGSALMETVRRINQSGVYNSTSQAAIWYHTDNLDISNNSEAQDLAGGSGPTKEKAAGLAGLTAALILVWALTGGISPEFTRIAGDILHSITGRGGQTAKAVEPVTPTQPSPEESAVENSSSSQENRLREDYRRDAETESRLSIDDQNEKDMTQESLVYDGEKWVKPEIVIQHMKHQALEIESETTSRQGLSSIWPDQEKNIGSYLSVPSRLIAAVNEYNHQNVRMINLDKLLDTALEEKRQVVEALHQAESEGRTGMADYLRGQLEIADENLARVNIARENCTEQIQAVADRIGVRGIGATMNLGEKGTSDVVKIGKIVINAGKLTNSLIDHARRGNLPGQRSVFRNVPGIPFSAILTKDLPILRLNRGEKVFSGPAFQGGRPVPSEALKDLSVDRGEVAPGDSALSGARPTVESKTGYTQLKTNADRAWKGETYRDMRVIRDTSSPHLGENNRRLPEYMRINPQGIQRAATKRRADPKAFEEMAKAHEYWHSQANLRYATNLTTVPGDNISTNLLRLQEVSNQIRVEEGVMQHVRMDFSTGKLPGVSAYDLAAFEQHNDDVLAPLRAERDALLLGLGRSP